jgi:DsbC/DsbD-like thiol-disulfide interchange protein
MMKKILLIGFVLFSAAFQIQAQEEPNPIKWFLSSEKPVESVKSGEIFKLILRAEIEKGWHLYALEKVEGGPLPTKISAIEDALFELGKIEVSDPVEFDDPAFGITTKFYEDSVEFKFPVKVSDKFVAGKSDLKIKIRFQTCNDQMCLPPKTVVLKPEPEKPQTNI